MKLERPDLDVAAYGYFGDALDMAQKNADALEADIDFLQGDLLEPLIDKAIKWDIVLSNPPYIPDEEERELSEVV